MNPYANKNNMNCEIRKVLENVLINRNNAYVSWCKYKKIFIFIF